MTTKTGMGGLPEVPLEGVLLAVASLPHPKDAHIRLVLVEAPGKFVTWNANVEAGGYSNGHYFDFTPGDDVGYRKARLAAYRNYLQRLSDIVD